MPLVSSFFGVPGRNATFDYVIAGGGTAGLALATRLAEADLSVAVVEAGGFYETDNSNYSVVPGYATFYTGSDPSDFQPGVDWGISTTPQSVSISLSSWLMMPALTCVGIGRKKTALCSWKSTRRLCSTQLLPVPKTDG